MGDDLVSALLEALSEMGNRFLPDELAYLALTSKVELHFRDRWAFALHKALPATYLVSREWKRTDLAILKNSTPLVLIELKAMYTFDAALDAERISGFGKAMDDDMEKAGRLSTPDSRVFTVLLVTHPGSAIKHDYEHVIKYRSGINRALRRFGDARQVRDAAAAAIQARLGDRLLRSGAIDGGAAFGVRVELLYWMTRSSKASGDG